MLSVPGIFRFVLLTCFAVSVGCSPRAAPRQSAAAATAEHSGMKAGEHAAMHGRGGDSSYSAMQRRGGMAMGVDQYTSSHIFDITDYGGRIALQRDADDSLGVNQIRAHLRLIRHAFEAGDFTTPALVHERDMPGTAVMSAKRSVITYTYADLPRGAEVRIASTDPEARRAVGQFLEAQRLEHRATGADPVSR